MNQELHKSLRNAIDKVKEIDVSGIDLDAPEPEILNVDQLDLDTHIIMQPSAIAYYGFLLSEAERELRELKGEYDRWLKTKMLEAGAQLKGSGVDEYKPTKDDKEGRVIINCKQEAKISGEDELLTWESRISELEKYRNVIKFWLDGFNTKNYLLKLYADRCGIERSSITSIKTPVEQPLSSMNKHTLIKEFKR